MRKTALKFTKGYSYISITKTHHIKFTFCTVVVHINTDISVEFHFDNCGSSQDMAFSATLPPSCPRTHSKLSVSTVARLWTSSSLLPSEIMLISLSLLNPSDRSAFQRYQYGGGGRDPQRIFYSFMKYRI